jgi:Zn-dependent peptidase ImmA (M78 family)
MTIVVNSGEQQTRQRFTIAHEVGEYLFPKEGEQYADQERAMNYFASELLMPRAWVQREWERWQEIERRGYTRRFSDLCATFGVSKRAMSIRMEELTGTRRIRCA